MGHRGCGDFYMKYKLILMFIFSFLVHITIAGALVYVPYHFYSAGRESSSGSIIWGQIQGAGSGKQVAAGFSLRPKSEAGRHKQEARVPGTGSIKQIVDQIDDKVNPPIPPLIKGGEQQMLASLEKGDAQQKISPLEKEDDQQKPSPFRKGGMGGFEAAEQPAGSGRGVLLASSIGHSGMGNTAVDTYGDNGTGEAEKGTIYSNQLKALIEQVKIEIEKNKYYPFLAKLKGIEGTVYVNFHIGQDGRPGSIAISRSSGSKLLDASAVKTIENLEPFRNINPELRELDVAVPITYKLREQ